VVRNKIDTIYQAAAKTPPAGQPAGQTSANPYDRTHQADRTAIPTEQWKHYHSAWQDYYRQYYERYYLGEVYRMRQTLENRVKSIASAPVVEQPPEKQPETDDTIYSLKSGLLNKVGASAVKVRKSRHFVPIMAAGLTMVVFLFLQYNRILLANVEAYVSPGSIDPANIIVDPTVNVPVSKEPRLIIPKINVDVPVIYDTKSDQASQLNAMQKGVAWFGIPGADSHPGQVGNTVLSGHSSNDLFDPGDFKFIFARLEQLDIDDTFYLNYQGTRYTYSITKKEVVRPTDVGKLIYKTDKPIVTLITCVPVGTAQSRLLVTAEQISPNPSLAAAAPSTPGEGNASTAMPGNSPTFINRIFGGD
jgi:sortase A